MTEAVAGVISRTDHPEDQAHPGTCGKPKPGTMLKVMICIRVVTTNLLLKKSHRSRPKNPAFFAGGTNPR